MVSEISDCTPSSAEFDTEKFYFEPAVRRGLAAVPDSIQVPTVPPKPNFLERFLISTGLIFVHWFTWTAQFFNWMLKTFFGFASRQKMLYQELHSISKRGDIEEIKGFLTKHSEDSSHAGFLFGEFLALPELYSHLHEILNGANVCLAKDGGFFCSRWRDHPDSYQRISSHQYQNEQCYAIGHFLFWLDHSGSTRFQFEKSPFKGFFSSIDHLIDYLRYKRDNEQQGVTGSSPHTEHYSLKVTVSPETFLARKAPQF